jgi:putative colanic acid biosynthesis acetyltransferase WcaF
MNVDLSKYNNSWYDPGRSFIIRAIWYILSALFINNYLNPSSKLKIVLLKLFGAKIGKEVDIKPGVNIKYPWNIEIGDHTWIGENVWLDSLEKIGIGNNVCISQDAYLCTGNHNYKAEAFNLIVEPIIIEDGVWVGVKAIVCPGVTLKTHSVLTAGSVATKDTEPYTVYQGNPSRPVRNESLIMLTIFSTEQFFL